MNLAADRPAALAGWKVLVTRPEGQADALCRLIEQAGGRPVRYALVRIERSRAAVTAIALPLLQAQQEWDWLIFVSTNAVRYACELGDWWRQRPLRPHVAAIGRGTAEALLSRGFRVDLRPKAQFNSEALLAAPELQAVQGQRFLIVRGEGGREFIADTLRSRGAEVRYAEVYRRAAPAGDASALIAAWRGGDIDAVVLSSGEALDNLVHLLGPQHAALLGRTPVAVIGERLAEKARGAGFPRVEIAAEASDQGLCSAVTRLAHSTRG